MLPGGAESATYIQIQAKIWAINNTITNNLTN
jgi:hypothetical protein